MNSQDVFDGVRTNEDFQIDLKAGHEYEDFVAEQLWNHRWPIYVYRSRKWQWKSGESVNGIEIKLDRKFRKSGNLFIETAERRTTDGTSRWRPSGIYCEHNPRILAIGDYQTIYLLGVRWLRHGCEAALKEIERNTFKGYILKLAYAENSAIDIIEIPAPESPEVVDSDDIDFK